MVVINGVNWNLIISKKEMEFASQYFNGSTKDYGTSVAQRSDLSKATALNAVTTADLMAQAATIKAAAQSSLLTKSTSSYTPVNASAAAAISAPSTTSSATLAKVGINDPNNGKGIMDTLLATKNYSQMFVAMNKLNNTYNLANWGGNNDWYIPSLNELNALYYAAKPEDSDSDTSPSVTTNLIDLGPPARPIGYSEPAKQTTRRSFQIIGDQVGAHAFRTDVPYMSATLTMQKDKVYAISFNDGTVTTHPLTATLRIRPIRRTSVS